jgi:Kef-type K+ transport system membrane component KefB
VLAGSEFRHQLESDMNVQGRFAGAFFHRGRRVDQLQPDCRNPLLVMGLVVGIVAIKAVVTGATGRLFGLSFDQNVLFTVVLSQIGEFAFVLFAFVGQLSAAARGDHQHPDGRDRTSMIFPPILILAAERLLLPYFGTGSRLLRGSRAIESGPSGVIIAGFGHFGSTIGRFLRANGVAATILDNDSDRVDVLRKNGIHGFLRRRDAPGHSEIRRRGTRPECLSPPSIHRKSTAI